MKKLVIPALLVMLVLAGCTSGGTVVSSPSSSSSASSVKPTPTPTVMTNDEAGAKYLSIVCPGNKAGIALDAAFKSGDIAQITAAAASARDIYQTSALALADTKILWPEGIAAELKKLSDAQFARVSFADQVSKATTLDEATSVIYVSDDSGAVAQKIRAQLGLPASTTCE